MRNRTTRFGKLAFLLSAFVMAGMAEGCAAGAGDAPSRGKRPDKADPGSETGVPSDDDGQTPRPPSNPPTPGDFDDPGGMPSDETASDDPRDCEEAEREGSYVGCDFWPTVVANGVWSIFDFAVVVANAGEKPADIRVERNGELIATATVAPSSLEKIYLPWVPSLKGPDIDPCGSAPPLSHSVRADGGAYHLTSSSPVTVYQFNALQYKGQGGPAGKSWSECPGNQICRNAGAPIGCYSFTNDASLLLPTPALTGNYRITTMRGSRNMGGYFTITATEDDTRVTVQVGKGGRIVEGGQGGRIPATGPGEVLELTMNRGDVVELVSTIGNAAELSGSLVQATKPIQIIGGVPCVAVPTDAMDRPYTCDHVEESVFPVETWGKHYVVTVPTGPNGTPVHHAVRLVGNRDGTTLTYPGGAPENAPTTIDAGQVLEFNATQDFEIEGDHEFVVASVLPSGQLLDPGAKPGSEKGDPSFSLAASVEQYRTKYVFLAPDDYDVSYADLVMPLDAQVTLDGEPLQITPKPVGSGEFGVARVKLGAGRDGAHILESDKPVGMQVIGYGSYTSYQYPGGLNLKRIAEPPPPIR